MAEIIADDVYYVLALASQAWARGFACVLTCSPHSTPVGVEKAGFGEREGFAQSSRKQPRGSEPRLSDPRALSPHTGFSLRFGFTLGSKGAGKLGVLGSSLPLTPPPRPHLTVFFKPLKEVHSPQALPAPRAVEIMLRGE